ncbi:MAG: hypothetical protein RLZZ15_1950 [Verrucomicrobiota bacterium]|jgi:hypothetical protein
MLSALLYLRLTSLKNWLWMRLQRLRQPKYLFGAIVGAAYFWFFFFRGAWSAGVAVGRHRAAQGAVDALHAAHVFPPTDLAGVGLAVGALALFVFAALAWVFSLERASLGFTEAEIAFLFPAPITRQKLVHFRLLDVQLRNLLGAAFMALFTNRFTLLGGNALTHAAGWWLVFTTFSLHLSGLRFTLTRLADAGLRSWPRRALVVVGVVAVVGITFALLPAGQRAVDFTAGKNVFEAWGLWARDLADAAPLTWVLWPAKLLLRPFFAADTGKFFLALGPALLVVGAHYAWVVRSVVSFEDGSIERASKVAARVAAVRSGQRIAAAPTEGRRPPFVLAGAGFPEVAFLWKNLLGTWPWFTARVWAACAATIILGAAWARAAGTFRAELAIAGGVALGIAGYVLVLGPQFARQDIRSDLANADLLKTYPLPGWRIVLGELLAPTAILTGVVWLALLTAAVTLFPGAKSFAGLKPWMADFLSSCFSAGARPLFALAVALVVPPLVALQLFVPNAAALVFPAWFQATRQRGGGGIDIMGQRLMFGFAQLFTVFCALIPSAIAGAVPLLLCLWLDWPALLGVWLAALGVIAVLVLELWLGLRFLGERFEKLDLSAELRP